MQTSCNDSIFGDMLYKHRWFKKDSVFLFGKDWEIITVAKAYSGKAITEEQRQSYAEFLKNKKNFEDAIANQVKDFVNSNVEYLATTWFSARSINDANDLARIVTPRSILVQQDGTSLLLMDCPWDNEHGFCVKFLPEFTVGSQDMFL